MGMEFAFYSSKLEEIESQLLKLAQSLDGDRGARFKINVAAGFIKHARQALTESLNQIEIHNAKSRSATQKS